MVIMFSLILIVAGLISVTKSLMGQPTQTTYYRYDEKGRLLTISAGHDNETDLEIEVLYLAGNYPSLIRYRMIQSVGKDVKYSMQLVYDHKFRISVKNVTMMRLEILPLTNSEKFNGVGKVVSKDVFVKPDKKTKTNFKFDYLGSFNQCSNRGFITLTILGSSMPKRSVGSIIR